MEKTAKTTGQNKAKKASEAAVNVIIASGVNTTKQTAKKQKNSIPFSLVIDNNKAFKSRSLFRVLDHLNNDSELMEACGLTEKLTINDLKALCPEYTQLRYDKKGNVKTILYSPFMFAKAMRLKYGQIK